MTVIYWGAGIIVYLICATLTFSFVHLSFSTYNNLKSLLFALFWPIGWLAMIIGGFVKWLMEE